MAVELALQLRKDQAYRFCRSGGGGDQALDAGAGTPEVGFEAIHHHLGVGDVVQGGDRAVADAELLMHHLHHRRQAVGGAGGGRNQPMPLGLIELVVDTENNIQRLLTGDFTLHRAGHDHPPKTWDIEVGLQGFWRFQLAAALQNHFHPCLLPGHGAGVLLLAVAEPPVDHHQVVALALRGLLPAPVHRIKTEQVRGCGRIAAAVVYMHQLYAWAAPEGSKHQAADAAKAVDANFHPQRGRAAATRPGP